MKKNLVVATLSCLLAIVTSVPVFAAGTGYLDIAWIKVKPNGIMVALEGFALEDADPSVCADPGLPYFWMPTTVENYEERYAALLSALNGDRQISIAYWDCGGSTGVSTLLQLGNVTIH